MDGLTEKIANTHDQIGTQVAMIKINKSHSFGLNSAALYIYQVYNNQNLSETAIVMIAL
jgi:hypothetical protein